MRKLLFCFVFLVLSFQLIDSTVTNINIKTVPYENVNVITLSSDLEVYERFNKYSDEYGDASFAFSSDVTVFDVSIFVQNASNDDKIAYKKLESQAAGEEIYVEVIPAGFTIVETPSNEEETSASSLENNSVSEENSTLEINVTSDNNLTGSSILENSTLKASNRSILRAALRGNESFILSNLFIFGEKSKSEKIISYVAAGILLLIVVLFISFILFKEKMLALFSSLGQYRKRTFSDIKIKKLSDLKAERKNNYSKEYERIVKDAQRKIDQAQRELAQIRNQDKILEAERKIQQDREELKRLKGR